MCNSCHHTEKVIAEYDCGRVSEEIKSMRDLYGTVPKGGSNGSCPFSNREWAGGTGFGSGTGRRCGCGKGWGIIGWWNVAFRNSDQNVFQEGNNFVCKSYCPVARSCQVPSKVH